MAVEPEKWKKIEFENERGYQNRMGENSEFGYRTPEMNETGSFPFPILVPPLIFKLDFLPFFGLYSQAETTNVTTKTRAKILGGVF